MAPNGYYVNGASVCAADGQVHLFHGVDRPSLEWSSTGDNVTLADFQEMASWNANVVRIALNQDFWLSGAALYDPKYKAMVQQTVQNAEASGLDVILDLHWSDRGDLTVSKSGEGTKQDSNGGSNQQQMADVNSVQFWTEVASTFKNDGRVLFELYNEPNGIGWSTWLNGGYFAGFQIEGMQHLHDVVRSTGAENIVIAGGLAWAFDLSGVRANPIAGHNVMYATHPYDQGNSQPGAWESSFGYLATLNIAPVIVTEFGDSRAMCTAAWDAQLISFADSHQISWTAWAWYPGTCSFPALLSDWTYSPTVQGAEVKARLATYPKYAPSRPADAGGDATTGGPVEAGPADATPESGSPGQDAGSPDGGLIEQAGPPAEGGAAD